MNPIFGYKASEELHSDSWGQLCEAVNNLPEQTEDALKSAFGQWEQEFKDTTNMPLPSAWRSAKSVIKGAIVKGVPFMDSESGKPRGKTAVEKDIKDTKTVAPLTVEEQVQKHLDAVVKLAKDNPLDRRTIASRIDAAFTSVSDMR